MALYDFRCANGHVTEAIRSQAIHTLSCGCGLIAERIAVNRGIGIVGPTTDTRGMFRRFTEASAEMDHAATRVEQQTGQAVQTPNLWKAAQERATAIRADGDAPTPRAL